MLKWSDVLNFAKNGNPSPDRRVEKTNEEWKSILTAEQFHITREKGTERAHSSELCNLFEKGRYACICCDTELFDSEEKYQSGTGWPSFTQPIKENAVAYYKDNAYGMHRIETLCNTCDAHLGHVFQDGPPPSGLRFCINAIAIKKVENPYRLATIGGGCFWCTEAIFETLEGVIDVESGYSGGTIEKPGYQEVSSGYTGHAEVVQIKYDARLISFEDILKIHLSTHNPTTLNKQGADHGSQYRSIIFYRNEEEREIAMRVIKEVQQAYDSMIVTELKMFEEFYKAELYHQDYYISNPERPYCQAVIEPKLQKFKKLYSGKMKQA